MRQNKGRDGALLALARATFDFVTFWIVRANGGYAGRLVDWTKQACGWTLEIIRRTSRAFDVLPKRWGIERTFAWLGKFRRLGKDYEFLPESNEAFIYTAMIHITVRRLN